MDGSRFESTEGQFVNAGRLAKKADNASCIELLSMIGDGKDLDKNGKLIPYLETALRRNVHPSSELVSKLSSILHSDTASFQLKRVVAYALHGLLQHPIPNEYKEQARRDAAFWLLSKHASRFHSARREVSLLVATMLLLISAAGIASVASDLAIRDHASGASQGIEQLDNSDTEDK